ncbi:tyrosinase family protein [Flavobacterium luteolum]|uniref:tyrosinase family protein n=1 Tax=Flavobacterium luteolum TaxID=3003259 RepID=UPI00248DC189|nr:tyrosinase family protein [Flavobacterium luteolum]
MTIEFTFNQQNSGEFYIGYTPVKCSIRFLDISQNEQNSVIELSNSKTSEQKVSFYTGIQSAEKPALNFTVTSEDQTFDFLIGAKFNIKPFKDNNAEIKISSNGTPIQTVKTKIRLRKNANDLTSNERDLFLNAFYKLNSSGKYQKYLDMHNEAADREIHGRPSFLPWHRMYLLDLERQLQEIEPSVALPYWDFQAPAPKVFSTSFMGIPNTTAVGQLQFDSTNPLSKWRIANQPSLTRLPDFNAQSEKARVESYETTLGRRNGFLDFAQMEFNPHGNAHMSFDGAISDASRAPQDPLFFMLHCNVDRLWAQWQDLSLDNRLFDPADNAAYNQFTNRIGDLLKDTMWPWNELKGNGRPVTSPSGPMPASPLTLHPGKKPKVEDSIDYQGRITGIPLFFDYDSVPYRPMISNLGQAEIAGSLKLKHFENLELEISKNFNSSNEAIKDFKKASDFKDIIHSLSQMDMITDQETTKKTLDILKDSSSTTGMRVLALSKLTQVISVDEDEIKYILGLVANTKVHPDLRKQAFRTIQILAFSSPIFPLLKPEVIETFRGLIRDNNIEIRKLACGYLAKNKDEFIQRNLLNGIKNPAEAFLPEDLAVHLLGYDDHAAIYPELRKILEHSSNNDSRSEAAFLLAGDPLAQSLLLNVANNSKERFDVRKNSMLSLKEQNSNGFLKIAKDIILDNNENDQIRTLTIKTIDSDFDNKIIDEQFIGKLKEIKKEQVSKDLSKGIKSFIKNQPGNK